jgi:hypothetical protein
MKAGLRELLGCRHGPSEAGQGLPQPFHRAQAERLRYRVVRPPIRRNYVSATPARYGATMTLMDCELVVQARQRGSRRDGRRC